MVVQLTEEARFFAIEVPSQIEPLRRWRRKASFIGGNGA